MAEATDKKTVGEAIAGFIVRFRFLLLGLLGASALTLLVVGIMAIVENQAAQDAAKLLDALRQDRQAYSDEVDQAKKEELEKKVAEAADAIAAKYPKRASAQQALMLKADLLAEKEDFAGAEKDYLRASGLSKTSYLGPVALYNAAVMAERSGNLDQAIAHLKAVTEEGRKILPGPAHAFFNLGRLQEAKADYKAAADTYQRMQELYPGDNWTNLGKSRIISLKSQGLIP